MAKYYVESRQLRTIVEAETPILAAARALALAVGPALDEPALAPPTEDTAPDIVTTAAISPIDLGPIVTVNERGFINDRPQRRLNSNDLVLETGTLLGLIAEHEL